MSLTRCGPSHVKRASNCLSLRCSGLVKPYVTTPILGGSKSEHFRTMYAIADRRLSDETVSRMDELSAGFVFRRFENQPIKEGAPL